MEEAKCKNPMIGDKWTVFILDNVLKNKTYAGYLIQGKKARVSHKKHNTVRVPEEDWIIVENHHPVIIREEIFHQVQEILYNRNSRVSHNGKLYKYTGYLKCADCNSSMHKFVYKNSHKSPQKIVFYCGYYSKRKLCTKHYITEEEIDEIVLNVVNKFVDLIIDIDKKISDNISLSYIEYENENLKFKLVELEKDSEKFRGLLDEIKKDYKNALISKNDFNLFRDRYMYELNKILLEKEKLQNSDFNDKNINIIKEIKENGKFSQVDRKMIVELIDTIYIHENKNIEIRFKYKDLYEDALRYLNS